MSKHDDDYDDEIRDLQIALVRYQQTAIASGQNDLVIFEGRDSAGKDGAIKRITDHLSVRYTRVVALRFQQRGQAVGGIHVVVDGKDAQRHELLHRRRRARDRRGSRPPSRERWAPGILPTTPAQPATATRPPTPLSTCASASGRRA